MGHEGTRVGTAYAINRGVDYAHPYYRDPALVLVIGVTPEDFIMNLFAWNRDKDFEGGLREFRAAS